MKIRYPYVLMILIIGAFQPAPLFAQTFVDINASGLNDGSSWTNAYTDLNVALSNTAAGEVWVANGTYRPVNCNPCDVNDRLTSFVLLPTIQLYGGFAGNETQLDQRDWENNLSILSGDIGVANDSTDNSFRVLSVENSLETTILDGFIIEEGNADGSSLNGTFFSGGGLYLDANPGGTANIRIRNCTFRNNFAGGGGAILFDCVLGGVSQALIANCHFENNTASTGNVSSTGGAILMLGNSGAQVAPHILDCTFENNYVGNDGGAISMTPSGATSLLATRIERCTFSNNESSDRGAGIWYRIIQGTSNVMIKDCQFSENIAGGQGGAVFSRASFDAIANDTLLNCIFSKNRSEGTSANNDGEGGGVFLRGSQTATRNHQVLNCVFDQNYASDRGGALGTTSFFDTPSDTIGTMNANLVNCSFYGNKTDGDGGAIHTNGVQGTNNMTVVNSILWRDSAAVSGLEIEAVNANVTVSSSNIDGGLTTGINDGGNNLDTNPFYNDPANGDLRIGFCSPLIDAGNNAALLDIQDPDPDGDARVWDGTVDLGAYEVGIIYVDQNASGTNTGTSWANAFNDLRDGINRAFGGDQIWVAQGTYRPVDCLPCTMDDRLTSLSIKSGTEMYGGFNGTETNLSQRDWESNLTIISGDIGVPIDSTDNSYRVLVAENTTEKTVFDGFIVEEGNADGSSLNGGFFDGGGLYINARSGGIGNLKIRNATFRNNFAGGGGAVSIDAVIGGTIEAEFRNCIFEGNTASTGNVSSTGGAILMLGNSGAVIKPKIIGCTFQNNFVGNDGGGISMTPSGATSILAAVIDSCTFINNRSTDRGAGIWYRIIQGTSNVVIKNSTFENNTAGGQGGGLFVRASFDAIANDTLINCIFSNNRSEGTSSVNEGEGGGVFLRGSQTATRNHQIINCVFDQNYASDRGGALGTTSFFDTPSDTIGTMNANVVNCTFSGNTTDGDGGAIHANGVQGTNTTNIANSIFWNDAAAVNGIELFPVNSNITLSTSIIEGGTPANINDGGNNLDADPQFLDALNGDLHISSCSPARDAGSDTFLPPDLIDVDGDENTTEPIDIDLDGLPRIDDVLIDMGAYEWNGTPALMTIALDSTDVSCNGFCDGTAAVSPEGGVPGYNILWSNGESTAQIDGLCPGTYAVTVSDNLSCVLEDSVSITENEALTLEVNSDTLICLGESITLNANLTGGSGNYSYDWNNGLGNGATHMVSPVVTTTYSVNASDDNNCTSSESILVTVNEVIPEIDGQLSICTGTSTILEVGNYETYLWSTNDETQSIEVTAGGVYSVTVTDSNGCTGTDEVEVIENENLTPEIDGQLSICTGTSTILDAGNYETYLWSTNDETQSIEVTAGGVYSVTVTDSNGCTGTDEVEVIENENLTPEIDGQLSICTGTSTILDAGNYETYLWSNNEETQSIEVSIGGVYTVTVTDANGCIGTDEVEVIENENLTPEIDGQLSICTGTSTILDAGNYETYLWSNNEETQSIEVSIGGVYSVTVTDANGCIGTDEVEVIENENLTPEIAGQLSICTGTSTVLEVGNYETYLWSNNEETQSIEVSIGGVYSVTVTDANGCIGTDEVEVIENDNLTPEIDGQLSICTGTSTVLEVGNYETYLWSTNEENQSIEVSIGGVYSVTVTDANGCTGTDEVEISEGENLTPEIAGQFSICIGTSTILDAGNYETYLWSNNEETQSIEVSIGGVYSVTVTDANGCIGTDEVEVIENDNLTPEIDGQLSICTGTSTVLEVGNYETYLWSNNEETQSIEVSAGGVYSVSVTDGNGCTGTDEVEVTLIESVVTVDSVELCFGQEFEGNIYFENTSISTVEVGANGCDSTHIVNLIVFPELNVDLVVEDDCIEEGATVIATVFGGNDNFSFEWSNGESGPIQSGILEGNISVTVSNELGCNIIDSVFVDPVATLTYDIEVQHVSCFGEADGEISVNVTGGLPPFQIEWTGGPITETLDSLSAGNYTIFISDGNGCVIGSTISVLEPGLLSVEVITTPSTSGSNGTATPILSGGTSPFSYQWSNGSANPTIENLSPGSYAITITDVNGCTAESTFLISNTTSVLENEFIHSFTLFPNPGKDQFFSNISLKEKEEIRVSVINILNQEVLDLGTFHDSDFNISFNMKAFSDGNYFLLLRLQENIIVKPFLKLN